MQEKLENPARLAELNPEETLKRIGLKNGETVCDIGAGSGIFTIAAARLTDSPVYALDINEELLKVIRDKAGQKKLGNVLASRVNGYQYDIAGGSVDLAMLVTVLHEIEEKDDLLNEIKRILKKTGKLAVIEFHKAKTPLGPPEGPRIAREEVLSLCSGHGLLAKDAFDLGDNMYCIVFAVSA
jgi:Methylase involved in ubiquinone/menaquinone biosynthesis